MSDRDDHDIDTPHAKRGSEHTGKTDQLRKKEREAGDRQEALIDEGLEESFPASDPVSVKRIT